MIDKEYSPCTIRDLTSGVIDIVGLEAVSVACGSATEAVSAWQSGAAVPDDDQLERLIVCSELVGQIAELIGKDMAGAWLESEQDAILVGNFEQARSSARAVVANFSGSWHCSM